MGDLVAHPAKWQRHDDPVSAAQERAWFDEAVGLFNAEKFWDAHEVLEDLWRTLEGHPKRYIQGLIQVAAGLVHHQRGTTRGLSKGFTKAFPKLESAAHVRGPGVDLEHLRSACEALQEGSEIIPTLSPEGELDLRPTEAGEGT